ncbi:multidrug resistance-associated ABC transporter [Ganoderma leucocontextum]|nr:multidrug resistance-associated ABC transporter [Ganoderma leucocontextum]
MWNPLRPQPAPPAFGQSKMVPEIRASPLSRLLFSWLDPFLYVGFSRPLEKEDFWSLPDSRLTHPLTERVEKAFYSRCPPESRPSFLPEDGGKFSTARTTESEEQLSRSSSKATKGRQTEETKEDAETTAGVSSDKPGKEKGKGNKPKYDSSLLKALHNVFWTQFWFAGFLKFVSDTLNTTTPLVNQVLLTWLTNSYIYFRASDEERSTLGLQKPQGIGYGIGLAFAIFAMQEVSSLTANHYFMLAMTNGLSMRTSLIGAIFRKSLRLSGRARLEHSVGQITTMISADTVRLERNAYMVHNLWSAPVQIALGIGLLIRNLGVSALVGFAILLMGAPIEFILARVMFTQRKKGVVLTDQRVRMTSEVLSGIRLIKYYAWESFYAQQVSTLRDREVRTIRRLAAARSLLIGTVTIIPIAATVLSIVTYALTKHSLNIAIIFSSVQYFGIIRMPLILLPVVLASATDALVALRRIGAFMRAEELSVPYEIDARADSAVDVDGDFTWETVRKDANAINLAAKFGKDKKAMAVEKKGRKKGDDSLLPTALNTPTGASPARSAENVSAAGGSGEVKEKEQEKPFELKGIKLKIPKGSFVAIVGRVGSGKSSLVQALIGEMRKTRGECTFSSTAAYVPQTAWIMNATLRQNIIFGQPEDDARFHDIIKACCLEPDLEMLPNGEQTEIGEKGINLSGGQKARVSLARAAYSGADIVLMDDSLSAVDSHVGKKLLDNCLLRGPLADKTRVLVTHTLHVLDKTDYIYVMDEGVVAEEGTYADLMKDGRMFARLMEEYGSQEENKREEVVDAQQENKIVVPAEVKKGTQKLMQDEERITGAVPWSVYSKYIAFGGGWTVLLLFLLVALSQAAQVANTLFLGFWTSSSIHGFTQGDYMGTYAALGVGSGLFAFALSLNISMMSLTAGLKMFKRAFLAVVRSPVAFFDTTPLGRIMSRLSKDQDTVDTELAMIANQVLTTASSVIGTAGLVFYTFPYLGIMFAPLIVLYYLAAIYYRRSSVEAKRLDSNLRSILYASYTETLTGLSTVRAYRSQDRFVRNAEQGQDLENRAYYMTIAIQRWLGVRLDILGNMLILGICLFAAGFRHTVDPSKIGVVLTYTLSITQSFSTLVSNYAQNEQNFNAVERILYYTELTSEGNATTPTDPPPSWPEGGAIEFKDVEMSYRPGLPPVLKGVSFRVNPGEKIGIVGRTGAGKSSLLQALFRIVNLDSGTIEIDGKNIAQMGLEALRRRLALVPQDSLLFQGTVRENLDPLNTRTDAEILDSLKRAWLLPRDGPPDSVAESKFTLDSQVSDEGTNYSAGEKQLLALCRALVKNSRIIVLDEATSSVDVETDAKVQRTIQTEFASSTLLCIAHRLNTIVYYDRILVMDAGQVAEFDAPLKLFDKEDSVFRSLCNEANLSRQDIVKIRSTVQGELSVPPSTSASVAHQSTD